MSICPYDYLSQYVHPYILSVRLCTIFIRMSVSISVSLFKWIFVVADLPFPILGADFLDHFGLKKQYHVGRMARMRSRRSPAVQRKKFIATEGGGSGMP